MISTSPMPTIQFAGFQTIEPDYFEIPKSYGNNDYIDFITRIADQLKINEMMVTDKKSAAEHIQYTIKHKLAIMALSYEYLGYISKRIMLHDIEKLILYTMMETKEASSRHRNYSIHHRENFSHWFDAAEISNRTESVLDYECARYTKPDKPLNAYATIDKYFPEDFSDSEAILKRFSICAPENNDCSFIKWNTVSGIYMPMFEEINMKAIKALKKTFSLETIDINLKNYNDYLSYSFI